MSDVDDDFVRSNDHLNSASAAQVEVVELPRGRVFPLEPAPIKAAAGVLVARAKAMSKIERRSGRDAHLTLLSRLMLGAVVERDDDDLVEPERLRLWAFVQCRRARRGRDHERTMRALVTAWNAVQAGRHDWLVPMARSRSQSLSIDYGRWNDVFWDRDDQGKPVDPPDPATPVMPTSRLLRICGYVNAPAAGE